MPDRGPAPVLDGWKDRGGSISVTPMGWAGLTPAPESGRPDNPPPPPPHAPQHVQTGNPSATPPSGLSRPGPPLLTTGFAFAHRTTAVAVNLGWWKGSMEWVGESRDQVFGGFNPHRAWLKAKLGGFFFWWREQGKSLFLSFFLVFSTFALIFCTFFFAFLCIFMNFQCLSRFQCLAHFVS